MSYKKFSLLSISLFFIFIGFHIFTWYSLSEKIFGLKEKESIGDLARLSYRPDMINKKTLEYSLVRSHIYKKNFHNQNLDLITIGDSFSYGGGFGKNPFYQDYLASMYNINVLNIGTKNLSEYLETIASLHNTNFFLQHKTKYLLFETVVRLSNGRIARKINWDKKTKTILRIKPDKPYHQDLNIISTANYKIFYYYILHHLFHKNFSNGIYKFSLTKNLFTPVPNEMLIYYSDIETAPTYTSTSIALMNKNLNKLAKILKKDGITLIFMPVVDKYDLYYNYIKNNHYPKNNFFQLFKDVKKNYIYIDTKSILLPLVQKGEKDIFYLDDTHWNYKASEAISSSKIFKHLFQHEKVEQNAL